MKRIVLITAVVISLVVISLLIIKTTKKDSSLVGSSLGVTIPSTPTPSISVSPTPKEFKYDSSTDLKKELDSINPEVLESDFQE